MYYPWSNTQVRFLLHFVHEQYGRHAANFQLSVQLKKTALQCILLHTVKYLYHSFCLFFDTDGVDMICFQHFFSINSSHVTSYLEELEFARVLGKPASFCIWYSNIVTVLKPKLCKIPTQISFFFLFVQVYSFIDLPEYRAAALHSLHNLHLTDYA